ncbi:YaaA family protein [Nesterenkonia natronophila]|uniref:Peroxide stress protein YaaA n=1 Tax=Nesterenkonia natronophila TaxID=2174932 RepID=A0A3A4F7S6_9MICC|nr:peroxide stress protein YaaA [Nesterenkonia natronophila]RJN31307.1 peroxide stress protein YaaA [Nesterenkonia natronophila]
MLPPSEGKTPPANNQAEVLDVDSLTLPSLAPERRQVLQDLISASERKDAQQLLRVGDKVMDEVAANQGLRQAPTAPAHQIYTGVLFDALATESLTTEQRKRAETTVMIFSGLFGVTGFTDRIPAYRCAIDVNLPKTGKLSSFWKERLAAPLKEQVQNQLVVDCRSASYARTFRPDPQQTLAVNSFTERDGRRTVVTHFAKAARGKLTGMLLRAASPPQTIDDVADIASQEWQVEVRPAAGNTPHQLDLISADRSAE